MNQPLFIRSFDRVRIAVEVEGQGPPLVLLHGITEDRTSWDPFVGTLANRFTLVRVDFRGHGKSDPVEQATLDDLVSDVKAVIDFLDLGIPAVLGHSLGGVVATWMAAQQYARRVVCVDQRISVRSFQKILSESRERFFSDEFPDALADEGVLLGIRKIPSPLRERLIEKRRSANPRLVRSLWRRIFTDSADAIDAERAAIVQQIKVPYLALHGEELDRQYTDWLGTHLPHAEWECWPGLGHWLHLVEPERLLDRVLQFFSE